MRTAGDELICETARLWQRVAYLDDEGVGHIAGVTGPDEYTALMDDNVFTNLMAQQNLRAAALDDASVHLADRLNIPYDDRRGVHEQAAGFTKLAQWDFTDDDEYPLMMYQPYLNLYRKQVVKQADLVLAMMKRPDAFTPAEKARNFAYYEARTVRDSSLSAPIQAVLAAELGHLTLAHDYLAEASLLDLRRSGEAGGDGLHIASLAGAWIAVVMGFGGMRDHGGLSFSPRLPPQLRGLRFRLRWRGGDLRVTITAKSVTYEVRGDAITFRHEDREITVTEEEPASIDLDPVVDLPAPPTPRPPKRHTITE
jgi:alpha,alpha-trehalose phosphorylase